MDAGKTAPSTPKKRRRARRKKTAGMRMPRENVKAKIPRARTPNRTQGVTFPRNTSKKGGGSVLARSSGTGSVGGAAKDRLRGVIPAQRQGILFATPREVLDGEVTSRFCGFHAETN